MGILDDLGNLAKQYASGAASETDVHSAYDQTARSVPQTTLADALTHTFNSDQTPPFEQMLSGLFKQSTPEQKAALLNQLASALPGGLASIAAAAGLKGVPSGADVSPQQAQQVTPQQVQTMAQQAAKKNPTIVDQAASFYAQHPTLVKSIGAGALALLMSRISQARR